MIFVLWVAAFYLLGTLYLIDWFLAQSKCAQANKWIMFTPFWPFLPSRFDDAAQGSLRRVRVYFGLAVVLAGLWLFGLIDK